MGLAEDSYATPVTPRKIPNQVNIKVCSTSNKYFQNLLQQSTFRPGKKIVWSTIHHTSPIIDILSLHYTHQEAIQFKEAYTCSWTSNELASTNLTKPSSFPIIFAYNSSTSLAYSAALSPANPSNLSGPNPSTNALSSPFSQS